MKLKIGMEFSLAASGKTIVITEFDKYIHGKTVTIKLEDKEAVYYIDDILYRIKLGDLIPISNVEIFVKDLL